MELEQVPPIRFPVEPIGWSRVLRTEFAKPYWAELMERVEAAYHTDTIFPPREELFEAFRLTDYDGVRVVILGQDPYHGPGEAHGLSFSVKPGVRIPPSLRNIYKELQDDLGIEPPQQGCLNAWARQGVLLLNAVLTVRQDTPNSHRNWGWERLTRRVLEVLNDRTQPIVFLLWGRNAQELAPLLTAPHHLVLESAHPSPLSARRGFFGSRPFSRINAFLEASGMPEIDWSTSYPHT